MTTRNSNAHFELAPQAEIERSTMNRDCNIKTSFNVGQLIPFYVDEVLPGDTFQIETSKVARLETLITPVMDNLYLDTYYFFVPNRLVWEHWKEFCGENNTSAWYDPSISYSVPQLKYPDSGFVVGSLADYFGLPVQQPNVSKNFSTLTVNALPFRAYCQIVNDWFRDENLEDPLYFPRDETVVQGTNTWTPNDPNRCVNGSRPFVAAKYHDYFTSCLPAPQKGPSINFIDPNGMAVVKTSYLDTWTPGSLSANYSLHFQSSGGSNLGNTKRNLFTDGNLASVTNDDQSLAVSSNVRPSNLYADLGNIKNLVNGALVDAAAMNINQLRQAFQIQRMLEKDARGGTRYIEILKTHFGVTSPDARLQRAEYLGGNRVPLNIEQVINTTGNQDLNLVPGETSGWSQTNDVHYDVEKSFVEHGFIIGLMCARYDHTYQEGIERFWKRSSKYDYYWPALAHLGEQAVYKSEIWYSNQASESTVFGYQEAWADYRYKPNYVTGTMRSAATQSLDVWHFADNYTSAPSLSSTWIRESMDNVNRALVVQGDNLANGNRQIFIDILVKNKCTRPMPLYSIPGLIDHF